MVGSRTNSGLRVLVVGGGIGGLTAALVLAREGHAVKVLERSARFAPAGAGIVTAVNASTILTGLGVDLAGHGHVLDRMEVQRRDGGLLSAMELGAMRARLGPSFTLSRPALHEALVAAVPAGVELALGRSVEALAADEAGVRARTDDGSEGRFDLVIGADGIHSRVRGLTVGEVPLRYSGVTCWRTICANPGVDRAIEMWGGRERVGLVPLRDGQLYVFLVRACERRAAPLSWEGIRAAFGGFGGHVPAVLGAMEGAALLHHDLEELEAPVWGTGRVLLLGDAAHAMTPNQGQGAAMAIEDAVALGLALRGGVSGADARYVAMRHGRVRKVQVDSRRIGVVAHWSNPLGVWVRDALVRLTPRRAAERHLEGLVGPGIELARGLAG